jgi:hypothetical protein
MLGCLSLSMCLGIGHLKLLTGLLIVTSSIYLLQAPDMAVHAGPPGLDGYPGGQGQKGRVGPLHTTHRDSYGVRLRGLICSLLFFSKKFFLLEISHCFPFPSYFL